jgi:hypothetical protein
MDWSLKGLLPRRGIGQLFGESGAGKTFVALDLVWHLAEGRDWFGWKNKHHSSGKLPQIFYLCLEGAEGFRNRVLAIKRRWYDPQGLPFPRNLRASFRNFSLFDKGEVRALVDTVNAEKGNTPPFIVIDTQAQAAPALNENAPEDMGRLMSAVCEIARLTDGFVLVVAHAGKSGDNDKGARGHSGQKAPCDVQIAVTKNADKTRTIKAVKVKDGEDGASRDFALLSVPLGYDEDGDIISACTVDPLETSPNRQIKLSASNQFALDCFKEARGETTRPVSDDEWRAVFYKRSTHNNPDIKRNAFNRAKAALQEKGFLLCSDNVYSLLGEPETATP